MLSNFYGLFTLISEPMGSKLLDETNKSNTPETAKERYWLTILHLKLWYEEELKPGSKSWESIKKVRLMHNFASHASFIKGGMDISQTALALTLFGFMGLALIRPKMLGIQTKCYRDREGFVHLWAVFGAMLGIKDEFNMCLQSIGVVEE